jgi:phage tail sheath protein FI
VFQAVFKLNKAERDLLYAAKINPIASFASNGTVVWGQKTLQQKASALDRLNVRILINRIKKWIESYGKTVLFDNNTASLRGMFTIGV